MSGRGGGRVVITGLGIVSSIGNRAGDVIRSLRENRSPMVFLPEMQALGYRCCVYAPVAELEPGRIPRRLEGFLSPAARYALAAATEAVADAGLARGDLSHPGAGVILGTGLSGRAPRGTGFQPVMAPPAQLLNLQNSSPAALVARHFCAGGRTASLSAACATGLYNLGHAYELLHWGELDVCITGSSEGDLWKVVGLSADNSSGMPTDFNDRPTRACRPYDRDHQGFIMSSGAGIVVMETLEHARARNARIYAEVLGYGAANDGADMFLPSGDGLRRAIDECLGRAELDAGSVDYINTHGTATPPNDSMEAAVIRGRFGQRPLVSSTKALSGHAQGATGAQELVFTVLMLHHGFVAPTVNLDNVAPECAGIRHVQKLIDVSLETAMKWTSGLGGTNACMMLRKPAAS